MWNGRSKDRETLKLVYFKFDELGPRLVISPVAQALNQAARRSLYGKQGVAAGLSGFCLDASPAEPLYGLESQEGAPRTGLNDSLTMPMCMTGRRSPR
jgi:hypothetical protein